MQIKIKALFLFFITVLNISVFAQNIFDAIGNGNLKGVKTIVEKDSKILKSQNQRGLYPLHVAASSGKPEITEYLIAKGADLNARDNRKRTALLLAAVAGQEKTAKILISKGADVNLSMNNGWSPLHFAASRGFPRIVGMLIDNDAEIDTKDSRGTTPLYWAVDSNQEEAALVLVKKGANVIEPSNSGDTPIQIAVENGFFKVVDLMLNKTGALNFRNPDTGRSLLHYAAINGYKNIIELLINKGIYVSSADSNGKTALFYAAKYGHKKIADILVEKGLKERNLESNFGFSPYLKRNLEEKEACIWYLGSCGWAVKTKSFLLIFDCWNYGKSPEEPLLANGRINPDEIKNLDVYVFISHSDYDHFDKTILNWKEKVKNIKYIFAWEDAENKEYVHLKPGEIKQNDKIKISCLNPTDSYHANSFFVETNGLSIFHTADASNVDRIDIDFFKIHNKRPDILFLSNFPGNIEVLKTLKPNVMFPMHNSAFEYKKFAENAKSEDIETAVFYAENRGDRFFFSSGEVK